MNNKIIEEMASIIDSFNIRTYRNAQAVAKFLIEKYNYRKINENEVVISKEEKQKLLKEMYEQGKFDALADLEKDGKVVLDRQEHQKYCAYKIIEPQIKGCLDRERELEKQVAELEEQRDRQAYIAEELIQEKHRWTEQAHKEAVKEFLTELFKQYSVFNDNDVIIAWQVKEALKELAKKQGVEVEV